MCQSYAALAIVHKPFFRRTAEPAATEGPTVRLFQPELELRRPNLDQLAPKPVLSQPESRFYRRELVHDGPEVQRNGPELLRFQEHAGGGYFFAAAAITG
jgi:hypothetical protein